MKCSTKIIFYLFILVFGLNTFSLLSQTKESNTSLKTLKDLYKLNQIDSVVSLTKNTIKYLKSTDSKDSLFIAKLYIYEFMGLHKTKKSLQNIASIDTGITYCPKTKAGDSLKAVFYNKKAYLENELSLTSKSYKSILKSLNLLENLPNPSAGSLMGAYLLLSNQNAYYGNFEKAKYYMRLAEDIYDKNKTEIDNNTWELNGNHHRLGVIAKYRKIYMLYKLSKNSKDSLSLVNTMKSLDEIHHQPQFHKEERIYYSTALNHVGDWFISHKHDSLTTKKDVQTGLKYLLKALDLTENKKYPGTPWAIKYNIAKGFTKGNLLEKADSTIAILFKGISNTDGRIPFFLAQKGLIEAKKNQKDSALVYFFKVIQKIHQGKDSLKTDYSNFTPSKSYNHTRLLLRITEELTNYYQKDTVVQKKVAKLYYLALQQFENSYLNVNFNSKQNQQLRQIIQGVLKSKKTGYFKDNSNQKTILNTFEIFKNELDWKKFYDSRYTNSLPGLDSIKSRKLELASLLSKAKITDNMLQQDSIKNLIDKHESYQKKRFPQLELLSDFKFSIEKLQQDLSSKDIILKYIVLENEIAIYQISKSKFKVALYPFTSKEKNQINVLIDKTRKRAYDFDLANKLGKLLIPTLSKNVSNLIINPDGMLFKLPFEILQIEDKFATEVYTISYTANLGFINYKKDEVSTLENVHIYAPNYADSKIQSAIRDQVSFLEGASNEAKSISKLFPSKLFNDSSLTKSEFIKTAKKGKVLHLAMHAEVNKDYPELSRLLFSNNLAKEDEHLYLEELYGLSLHAELAILSACNTGAGLEKNGSLASFQRAFTFAGVPATIASLWEVPDAATNQIMILFYENLKTGQTKSEALRNAKLSYRNKNANNKLAAPYFWAGFVVYGSDTPVVFTDNTMLIYSSFIVIILIFLIIWFRKKM